MKKFKFDYTTYLGIVIGFVIEREDKELYLVLPFIVLRISKWK